LGHANFAAAAGRGGRISDLNRARRGGRDEMDHPVVSPDPSCLAAVDQEVAADQRECLSGREPQFALIHRDPARRIAQKAERLGRRDGQAAAGLVQGREARAVGKAQLARRADVQRAGQVERGVGSEHDAGRVEEVEVGLADPGRQRAVNGGDLAAGHPADHVPDGVRPGEGGGLAGGDAEPLEAVEQVVAAPGAEVRPDLDLWAGQAGPGPDRAVGDDLRLGRS
jgi:hypothetical protein